jgi:tetratricopeptide (TPR) repeat protein
MPEPSSAVETEHAWVEAPSGAAPRRARIGGRNWFGWPVFLLLAIALGLAIYAPVRHFEFLNYDDDLFVSGNPWLRGGLTWASVRWAFGANLVEYSSSAEYWEPITLLSRLADAQVYGIQAGPFHVTSALLHLLNAVLLAAALWRLTGKWERSAVVALIFLVHPFGVEPVCWLSARKDLLSATFLFVTLLAYQAYAAKPSWRRYFLALLAYVGALMAKPMAVSIPGLLLVLDWWPLLRWQAAAGHRREQALLLAEKAPFMLLAAAASYFAIRVQRDFGALQTAGTYPLMIRASNAALAYLTYLRRAVWPSDLAGFYPYAGLDVTLWEGMAAAVALLAATGLLFRLRQRAPFLWSGWLWFGITLGPVIGLVQIGNQGMADRYAYPSAIGLYFGAVWLGADALRRSSYARVGFIAGALAAYAICSAGQALTWRDSVSMFRQVIAVSPECGGAYINLGAAYHARGDLGKARACYLIAIKLLPHNADAWFDLGNVDFGLQRDLDARDEYAHALDLKPASASALLAMGNTLSRLGDAEGAFHCLEKAIRLDPGSLQACLRLSVFYQKRGAPAEVDRIWAKYLELHPSEAGKVRELRTEIELPNER